MQSCMQSTSLHKLNGKWLAPAAPTPRLPKKQFEVAVIKARLLDMPGKGLIDV
jgi:hypothetical protein